MFDSYITSADAEHIYHKFLVDTEKINVSTVIITGNIYSKSRN